MDTQATGFAESLRAAAETHGAAQIDMQMLLFQQGRDIARAYVDMMKSYARLTARSGCYQPGEGGKMTVSGFCRMEDSHFGREPLLQKQKRTHSLLSTSLSELRDTALNVRGTDLFSAFCTSFAEFCKAEGIRAGKLCVLVRRKDGTAEYRELPAVLHGSEHAEAIGYPYEITF